MKLSQAIRVSSLTCLALTGAGGKTTALFQLARDFTSDGTPVLVTATTHLHVDQVKLADSHRVASKPDDLSGLEKDLQGVVLVTGPVEADRTTGVSQEVVGRLREIHDRLRVPLLIEADGSRKRPLKAPAEYEPVIPDFVETVLVVAGLSGLGKPLTNDFVHRPEIYARLSGLEMGEKITSEAFARVLTHPSGGMKNIPPAARRVALLNQADTPALQAQAKMVSGQLLGSYDSVVAASLNSPSSILNQQSLIHAVYEPIAGIILAAGGSTRFGQPKQLLDWHGIPFIRAVAKTALQAGLSPVIVVTGARAEQVEQALTDLKVNIARNPDWQSGQSSSIQAGLRALTRINSPDSFLEKKGKNGGWKEAGAAIFLLVDQPQITPTILQALVEEHARTLAPVVAPIIGGQRANPILFDRVTFPDLMALKGDAGGRAIFSKVPVNYLTWHDENLLSDVDTPEDYRKLAHGE